EGDRLLVVPVSGAKVRVGGVLVGSPEPLNDRVTIEFDGAILRASVLGDAAEDDEPTSEMPTQEVASARIRDLPTDVDTTWDATEIMPAFQIEEEPGPDATQTTIEFRTPLHVLDSRTQFPAVGDPDVSTDEPTRFDFPTIPPVVRASEPVARPVRIENPRAR